MKAKPNTFLIIVGLLAYLLGLCNASAFYDPGTQRWLNRDPAAELGFRLLRQQKPAKFDISNFYRYVGNTPVDKNDPQGLAVWVCTQPANMWISGFRHAYFWDDKSKQSCERNESNAGNHDPPPLGQMGTERDPDHNPSCVKVEGSEGQEEQLMDCCQHRANAGRWSPLSNDCHNTLENCLNRTGLQMPFNPRVSLPLNNHIYQIYRNTDDF